jgi:signal peptidase II
MIKINKSKLLPFLVILVLIIIDQLSKSVIFSNNIKNCLLFFCIKIATNHGIVFGLFNFTSVSGMSGILIMTYIVSFIVVAVSIFYIINNKNMKMIMAFGFIVAGTGGNLIDRIMFKYVRDFITFSFWQNFPAFNLADVFNIVGVVLLVILLLTKQKSKDLNR